MLKALILLKDGYLIIRLDLNWNFMALLARKFSHELASIPTTWNIFYCVVSRKFENILLEYSFEYS